MVYIGIDNGVTGSVGIITPEEYFYIPVPTFKLQDYTKKKKILTRIDTDRLFHILNDYGEARVAIERPMISPARFTSSLSAARSLEATLIVIKRLGFGHLFIDSKTWVGELLPVGVSGTPELKAASFYEGCRLFPRVQNAIERQKDADGILIAEWLKRHSLGSLKKVFKNP